MRLTIKQLVYTREKRRNQENIGTRLKKALKRQRMRLRAIEKRSVLRLRGKV